MSKSAASVRDEFRDFLVRMAGYYKPYPELRSSEAGLHELGDSLSKPFTLAVFGYMKTGKSSLINALLSRPLTITGTNETTATLNRISYGDATQKDEAVVHWKDGRLEPIPLSRISEWVGKSEEVLKRVRETSFLQLFANAESLKNVQIVDTPGIGAVVAEHTQIASDILSGEEGKKADALLYVFPAVAKQIDLDKMMEFAKTRLPGSDPYNSIGVLHMWDGLEADNPAAEAAKKAKRMLCENFSDVVCDVIPVSAPLGLVSRHAPRAFWEGLIELELNRIPSDCLLAHELWDDDPGRRSARDGYKDHLPWVSFVRMVRLLREHSCDSVAAARAVCLEASGIERLEAELDSRFYLNAVVIKQRLVRVKAHELITEGILFFNERAEALRNDQRHFGDLVAEMPKGSKHATWLGEKRLSSERERLELEEFAVEAQRIQLIEEERMNLMESDLEFLEQMNTKPGFVEHRDQECIKHLLTSSNETCDGPQFPREVLLAISSRYQYELQGSEKRKRILFDHLTKRIQEKLRGK